MVKNKYFPPSRNKTEFHCPYCGVFAHQTWAQIAATSDNHHMVLVEFWFTARCSHCSAWSIWHLNDLIFPEVISVEKPNEDLSSEIQNDYNEAASVLNKSPKASAALLRLAIQKLCKQLGESGEDINKDIGKLVEKGLPVKLQKALDSVRVIGNEAVHPGEINLDDNKDIAYKLFELINIIANQMITQDKEINKIYSTLPENKLQAIQKRDAPNRTG
jgi:hypothetical protein